MTETLVKYAGEAGKAVKAAGSAAGVTVTANNSADSAEDDPLILLYPSDVGENVHQASWIMFTGYSVATAKLKDIETALKVKPVTKIVGSGIGATQVEDKTATKIKQFKSDYSAAASGSAGSSLTLSRRNVPKSGTVIGLYMPPSVNVSYSMDYEAGPIGEMTEAVAGMVQDVISGASLGQTLGKAAGGVGSAVKKSAIGLADKVAGGAADLVAIERGVIITPRTELMFRGISRREFSFTFTFIPKDMQESITVKRIVQKFKEGMTPAFAQTGTTRELTIPDVFQIDYMYINRKNSYLNKLGKCYLQKMDVTYGGDKYVTYDHGGANPPPQKTVIALAFKELEVMDRAKVEDGF